MEKLDNDDIFKCKNCKNLIEEPYESECCGNLFCKICSSDLRFTKCQQCKIIFNFRKNLFAKNLMKKIQINCEHNCGKKFTLEEMKLHLLRCESKLFKCDIINCYFVGKKKDIVDHVVNSHFKELLIMMENYEDFKSAFDKLIDNINRDNKIVE